MGHPRQRPSKRPVISAVSLCVVAALSGCAASSPTGSPRPATAHSTGSSRSATTKAMPKAAPAITVAGDRPVLPGGSQDTHAQTAGASCDQTTFAADRALGARVTAGFAAAGFPASAALLTHFLKGTGTEVDYRAGSAISKKALASTAFQAVNNQVQAEVLSQLKAARTRVRLSAAQLPMVAFESSGSDLYWGFRGTQGLTVTGSVHRENGRYAGTLSYVIRDSYGFPVSDTLAGFGPPMRYLQTVCGAPQHAGGAHWFPDTIAVTVPFSRPA
jgi:hypothetical protein